MISWEVAYALEIEEFAMEHCRRFFHGSIPDASQERKAKNLGQTISKLLEGQITGKPEVPWPPWPSRRRYPLVN